MPLGTTVTRSEMRVATESVKEHGKAMFNLDGQVLEKNVESIHENSIS